MAKRLKFKLPSLMPSFQICRSKNDAENPTPAIYRISHFNRKALDINYPKLPDPPPSTPTKPHLSSHRKISRSRPSRPLQYYLGDCSIESFSYQNNGNMSPVIVAGANHKNKKDAEMGSPVSSSKNDECCRFSSEANDDDVENDADTESLLYSSRSFSYDSSFDFCYPAVDTLTKKSNNENKKTSNKKVRKLKRQVSKKINSWNNKLSTPETNSPTTSSILRRIMSSTDDGRANESVAVVQKSEDPYADFKRSMLEMILEKQMFEDKDLEQLLKCFLALNSRQYHGIIVEAFSEIWESLFCDSHLKKRHPMRVSRFKPS